MHFFTSSYCALYLLYGIGTKRVQAVWGTGTRGIPYVPRDTSYLYESATLVYPLVYLCVYHVQEVRKGYNRWFYTFAQCTLQCTLAYLMYRRYERGTLGVLHLICTSCTHCIYPIYVHVPLYCTCIHVPLYMYLYPLTVHVYTYPPLSYLYLYPLHTSYYRG